MHAARQLPWCTPWPSGPVWFFVRSRLPAIAHLHTVAPVANAAASCGRVSQSWPSMFAVFAPPSPPRSSYSYVASYRYPSWALAVTLPA